MLARTLIKVTSDRDLVAGRRAGRRLARQVGFKGPDIALVTMAIAEMARYLIAHAGDGALEISTVEDGARRGLEIVVRDESKPDFDLGTAVQQSKASMDEFDVQYLVGDGTTITMRKWLN